MKLAFWRRKKTNKKERTRVAFLIDETMTGEGKFKPCFGPEGERFMEFAITWGTGDLEHWLDPKYGNFMQSDFNGTVTVEGLCQSTYCEGRLKLDYFGDHSITYEFDFLGDDGKCYQYTGKKRNIRLWNLPWSHTTCYGEIVETFTGKVVFTSVTHFRLRTLIPFLRSLRFFSFDPDA